MRDGDDGTATDRADDGSATRDDAWVREVLRLTRRARTLDDGPARRARDVGRDAAEGSDPSSDRTDVQEIRRERDAIAERHGYGVRLRDADDVLVCYPLDWLDDGTVDLDSVEDLDRAVEVSLGGGSDDVADVRDANDAVVEPVLEEADDAVGYDAAAFAEYCENHHRARLGEVSRTQVERFLEEYYPRNVWPPDGAEDRVEEALRRVLDRAGRDDLVDWLERRDGIDGDGAEAGAADAPGGDGGGDGGAPEDPRGDGRGDGGQSGDGPSGPGSSGDGTATSS